MRYAILSDIHGNLPALEAVLAALAEHSVDRVLCLGDMVGYGAQPNECCDLLRDLDPICVRGNHDHAAVVPGAERWFTPAALACILWTREELSAANRAFLLELEALTEVDGAQLYHGSLFDPDYYTTTPHEASLSMQHLTGCLAFFGHTHYSEWFTSYEALALPVQHPAPHGAEVVIKPGHRYMVNPGSVGQPRDGNSQAAYAIWDADQGSIVLRRAVYNIRAAQDRMQDAGLPTNMSSRLLLGV